MLTNSRPPITCFEQLYRPWYWMLSRLTAFPRTNEEHLTGIFPPPPLPLTPFLLFPLSGPLPQVRKCSTKKKNSERLWWRLSWSHIVAVERSQELFYKPLIVVIIQENASVSFLIRCWLSAIFHYCVTYAGNESRTSLLPTLRKSWLSLFDPSLLACLCVSYLPPHSLGGDLSRKRPSSQARHYYTHTNFEHNFLCVFMKIRKNAFLPKSIIHPCAVSRLGTYKSSSSERGIREEKEKEWIYAWEQNRGRKVDVGIH